MKISYEINALIVNTLFVRFLDTFRKAIVQPLCLAIALDRFSWQKILGILVIR